MINIYLFKAAIILLSDFPIKVIKAAGVPPFFLYL